MIEFLKQPWPWYVAGPIIGLTVPALLLLGNKSFGISSSLRHICASCFPSNIPFFKYNWKKEIWNLFFVLGILIGGFLTMQFLQNPEDIVINSKTVEYLESKGISEKGVLVPADLFTWENLFSLKGFLLMVVGGFLVGFGTRYAGGCTSGHSITGIANLQWPSLVATICFMIGGLLMANFILPYILNL